MSKGTNNFEQSLVGHILISTPTIDAETVFSRALVLVISHDVTGTVGVIVNRVLNSINNKFVFKALNINHIQPESHPVYFGGPVDPDKGLILHSSDYKCTNLVKVINANLSLSSHIKIFEDIAEGKGPKNNMLILGYSTWQIGQLENEFKNNAWIVTPYNKSLIFSEENSNKWEKAVKALGINPAAMSNIGGNA